MIVELNMLIYISPVMYFEILKLIFQNYSNILNKCFLVIDRELVSWLWPFENGGHIHVSFRKTPMVINDVTTTFGPMR